MAVGAAAGDKIGARAYLQAQARSALRRREALLGVGLLLLAFVAAFAAREAGSTHAAPAVAARPATNVVEPTITVEAPQQIAASASLKLPPVHRVHARRRLPVHHAAAPVAAPAVRVAPVTQHNSNPVASAPSVTPSTGSGVGVVGSGATPPTGSAHAPVTSVPAPAPTTPTPAPSAPVRAPSGSSGTGTTSGGSGSSSSSSSSGSGNVSGGG